MAKYTDAFLTHCKGGKRVRAYLVKLGYELCGKEADDRIILPSLSYELFQTGVLIHDDILATGGTAKAAIQLAKEAGAKTILFNCIIEIVSEGLEGRKAILEAYPDVVITSLIKL